AGGVFLIGLGLLFANVLPFWPGILFVIGAASIARGMAEGQAWYSVSGGLWIIGVGLLFLLHFSWPMLLILVGVAMLFGYRTRDHWRHEEHFDKWKHEWKRKHDEADEQVEII